MSQTTFCQCGHQRSAHIHPEGPRACVFCTCSEFRYATPKPRDTRTTPTNSMEDMVIRWGNIMRERGGEL